MKNLMLLTNMINTYNSMAYAHHYIFGYTENGVVYATITTSNMLSYIISLDKTSYGAGYVVCFRPNKEQRNLLKIQKTICLCSVDYFKSVCAESKYNKGEIFEKLITEYYGQEWEKDNVPFTKAGDIEINGIAYQIKFQGATFCNEKTLRNLKNKG